MHPPSPTPPGWFPPTTKGSLLPPCCQPGTAGSWDPVQQLRSQHCVMQQLSSSAVVSLWVVAWQRRRSTAQKRGASGTRHAAPRLAEPWGEGERGDVWGDDSAPSWLQAARGCGTGTPAPGWGGADPPRSPLHQPCLHLGCIPASQALAPLLGCQPHPGGVPAAPVLSQAPRSPARCCGHHAEPRGGAAPCLQQWGWLAGSSPCPRARWGHLLFLQRGPPLPHHHHRSVIQASCRTGVPCAGCVQRCREQNGALGTNPRGLGAAPGAAPEGPAHHGRSWPLLSQAGHCAQHRLASTGQGQAQAMGGMAAVPTAATWVVRRDWGSTETPPGDSSPASPERQLCLGTLQSAPQGPPHWHPPGAPRPHPPPAAGGSAARHRLCASAVHLTPRRTFPLHPT